MNSINKLHIYFGLLFLVLFLASGVYMNLNFPGLYNENEVMRMMYRSNHIYILFASLINITLGSYFEFSLNKISVDFQKTASVLLLVGPIFLLAAFILEPVQVSFGRPFTFLGVLLFLIGVLLHMLAKE